MVCCGATEVRATSMDSGWATTGTPTARMVVDEICEERHTPDPQRATVWWWVGAPAGVPCWGIPWPSVVAQWDAGAFSSIGVAHTGATTPPKVASRATSARIRRTERRRGNDMIKRT